MIYPIISLLFVIAAAVCKAVMDKLQFHYSNSIFSNKKYDQLFWNPKLSWRNKWKNGNKDEGEAFWGSSRWFVNSTDAWHRFQSWMITFWVMAILLPLGKICGGEWWMWIVGYALLKYGFTMTFELFFSKVFEKK